MAVDDSRIGDDEYRIGHNVRNRFGELRPIKRPEEISAGLAADVPVQALYALGDFLILIQDGNAYFKHRLSETWITLWSQSTNASLRLDSSAEYVYVQAVPDSGGPTFTYKSKNNTDKVELDSSAGMLTKTEAAVVVQDGVNQPNLIIFSSTSVGATATVRKARTFAEHGTTIDGVVEREYVPVGKQMMFFNSKLYIISPDGKTIYHSVSGRPLDFVIAINSDGNKISSVEEDHGASALSYAVSYEAITCIAPLNTESLLISTRTSSFAVTPNYNITLYGEPTFTKRYLFGASVVNQFSFVDMMGDFGFIDAEGLRSFNAVRQLRNEGRNSAFSLKVAKLFEGAVQLDGAAISFDNYTFFSVKTIYGFGVLVFDGTLQKFVSLDQYKLDDDTTLGQITQFSKIDTDTVHELYGVTAQGKLLRLFTGGKYNDSFVQTKAFNTGTLEVEQKPMQLRMLFNGVEPWEYDAIRMTEGANVSPNGVNVSHSSPGTLQTGSAFELDVEAIPFDLASGTEIFFTGSGTNEGGTFALTVSAAKGATALTGTFTSTGIINKSFTKGFISFTGEGTARAAVISNARKSETPSTISKTIAAPIATAVSYGDTYPVMWNNENKLQNFLFNFQQGRQGLKVGYTIEWNTNATLSMITAETTDLTPKNPFMTQAYGSNS